MWCALAQIIINKEQGMLAQITRNNFFSMKGQGQGVLAQIKKIMPKLDPDEIGLVPYPCYRATEKL